MDVLPKLTKTYQMIAHQEAELDFKTNKLLLHMYFICQEPLLPNQEVKVMNSPILVEKTLVIPQPSSAISKKRLDPPSEPI